MIVLLSYIFYFVIGTISPLQRRWLLKDKKFTIKEQITFTFQCVSFLFLGSLTFPFFSPFYISDNYYYLLFLFLICGLFGALHNIVYYIAQKHVDASVTTIVSNMYTPVAIVLASLLLKEGLSPLQIVGTILLLIAIFIISKKHRMGHFSFDKYFLLMLGSACLLGILVVAERALQITTGFSAGVMISWGAQVFFLGLTSLFIGQKHFYTKREVFTTGTLQFLHAFSWVVLVYTVGNLSIVSAVTTFKVVLIFIAAAIFLKEREDLPRKIFGSTIAVIGLLLM